MKLKSNKTAYVGSLRVNHSDMASRFIVGQIELPIANSCMVANPNISVLNYSTATCKFSEDGVSMLINADVLLINVSVKCSNCNCNCNLFAVHKSKLGYSPVDIDFVFSRKIIMHGA